MSQVIGWVCELIFRLLDSSKKGERILGVWNKSNNEKIELKIVRSSGKPPLVQKPPKWWEMPYDPEWEPRSCQDWRTVYSKSKITKCYYSDGKPDSPRTNEHISSKSFTECDFSLQWKYSSFTSCHFKRCRFPGSYFDVVKFSGCTFEECNFSHFTLNNCQFIKECVFIRNSVSAEEFKIKATTIDASSFLEALITNVKFIPLIGNHSKEYQCHKLIETKAEVAQKLYASTREESNVDCYFDAYKQLTLCSLDWHIAKYRYVKTSQYATPTLRSRWKYECLALPRKLEKPIIQLSGYLTNWGRSLARPLLLFVLLLIAFSSLYIMLVPGASFTSFDHFSETIVRAIDVTLVAGYTAHCSPGDSSTLRAVTLINMVFGLYWYSLVVPTLTRRLLR